jgi:hypothetical protein
MNNKVRSILIVIGVVIFLALIWKSQQKRLDLYDQWYMCMYEDWNHDRCNKEVYGQ